MKKLILFLLAFSLLLSGCRTIGLRYDAKVQLKDGTEGKFTLDKSYDIPWGLVWGRALMPTRGQKRLISRDASQNLDLCYGLSNYEITDNSIQQTSWNTIPEKSHPTIPCDPTYKDDPIIKAIHDRRIVIGMSQEHVTKVWRAPLYTIQPENANETIWVYRVRRSRYRGNFLFFKNNVLDSIKEADLIQVGMTPVQAIKCWSRPSRINRDVWGGGVREQWVYQGYDYKNDYLYFQDGVLSSWQTSR